MNCARTLLVIASCLLIGGEANRDARISNHQFEINEDGSYNLEYATSDGIEVIEEGTSYPGNAPETGTYSRSGSYSYVWDGVTYTVTWEADENGYYAQGDHLPK